MTSLSLRRAAIKCASGPKNSSRSAFKCFARYNSTTPLQERPLETVSDWTQFQLDRLNRDLLLNYMSTYGSTQTRENTYQPHHSLHRPPAPSQATLSALVASGAHLGHAKSLMNSNFMPYAYGVRAGITIIDLDQTLPLLRRAANLTRAVIARDGTVVFVGTRPNLKAAVRKAAERIGSQAYHVGERWLPGTLTNQANIFGSEAISNQQVAPDLVVILNPLANMHVIRECAIQHIPTIGIIDSNVDPRIVMYPIPANDESTRTAELIAGVLSIAGREGKALLDKKDKKTARNRERFVRGWERAAGRGQDID